MGELRWTSASEQARLLARGEVTGVELRDAAVAACEELDPGLGFLVAPLADRAPPGIPILLKDAGQELAGTPHHLGVAALRDAGHRSRATTGLAARFEAAGFSIVGKAACPPLANGVTTEPPGFAPTRNPWDRSRSAGGSSGGSAAAVACGAVPVAHGSDATGSLRCPAALCGLVTLVPTAGRIPSVPPAGQPANEAWRDFVLARGAEDLRLVFDLLTGTVPSVRPGAAGRPPGPGPGSGAAGGPGARTGTTETGRTRLRVGLLDHDPEMGLPVHPACVQAVAAAGALLERLGHHVEPAWPPALGGFWAATGRAFAVVGDATRPPVLAWVSERLGRPVRPGELDAGVFAAADRAAGRTPAEVEVAQRAIDEALAPVTAWWDAHDLLVTPATFQPAWPLGGHPGPRELGTLAAPFSLSGQPALAVPIAHGGGLPVGVQVVGRRGADDTLLDLAADLQAVEDWTARRPPVPELRG